MHYPHIVRQRRIKRCVMKGARFIQRFIFCFITFWHRYIPKMFMCLWEITIASVGNYFDDVREKRCLFFFSLASIDRVGKRLDIYAARYYTERYEIIDRLDCIKVGCMAKLKHADKPAGARYNCPTPQECAPSPDLLPESLGAIGRRPTPFQQEEEDYHAAYKPSKHQYAVS